MATSAFKSTTRRTPVADSPENSPASSSSSKPHRRSRSLSRFSPRVVAPTPRRKFVNTVRGSDFPDISLDDLAIEFFSNTSELDDESVSSRSSQFARVKSEVSPPSSHRRSRSVSRNPNGANSVGTGTGSATGYNQRRGRSVSRRNDGNGMVRRSVSVARNRISDTESDIDLSRSSASQTKSRSMNNDNSRVASFQRPTASSHRRLTRSMSQAPQLRSHDDYMSQSSAPTDDDLRYGCYGRNEIEKTIRAVYAQKKIDHPSGDDANLEIRETMKKELKSAVNQIMIEFEQEMERKSSALSVHDRLYSKKSDATTKKSYTTKLKQLEEQQDQNGFKIVKEVIPESKSNANAQKVSHSRKRSNDRNRVSRRLNDEAEKYFEDFISNVEDTDFSSFDEERSDTSSSLVGTIAKQVGGALPTQNGNNINFNIVSVPMEMEGIKLPWLKWDDDNDGVHPTTPKTKLWDPAQDLKMIQEHGSRSNSSHGSWNPEHTTANSTNAKGYKIKENKSHRFDRVKYIELARTEEALFDSWRERSVIRSGGLLLCSAVTPF
ncbi:uncharacterized protein LOC143555597 [Bidens hawaiensis]|uniref:uncharacterized protein LOC143555597 n=1 Tax=Bidens hawaiensis TaxID=980011 RepID=UPI0040498930